MFWVLVLVLVFFLHHSRGDNPSPCRRVTTAGTVVLSYVADLFQLSIRCVHIFVSIYRFVLTLFSSSRVILVVIDRELRIDQTAILLTLWWVLSEPSYDVVSTLTG